VEVGARRYLTAVISVSLSAMVTGGLGNFDGGGGGSCLPAV
jgi:hypothetical protein